MRPPGSALSPPRERGHASRRAFTLLELVTCVLIVAILAVMLMPLFTTLRDRAERTKCIANLKGLHVAAELYLQEHRQWPQVQNKDVPAEEVATAWINILHPYGLEQINWICPTVQRALQSPDLTNHENVRIDYAAFPFDTNPTTPKKWPNMPWFIESNSSHGKGSLLIFRDGNIDESDSFLRSQPTPPGSPH